jgi:hypothetical protein
VAYAIDIRVSGLADIREVYNANLFPAPHESRARITCMGLGTLENTMRYFKLTPEHFA